jgi:hypothetical protein
VPLNYKEGRKPWRQILKSPTSRSSFATLRKPHAQRRSPAPRGPIAEAFVAEGIEAIIVALSVQLAQLKAW